LSLPCWRNDGRGPDLRPNHSPERPAAVHKEEEDACRRGIRSVNAMKFEICALCMGM
jgi:hypothetical protein